LLVLCILALLMDATRGAWIVSALIALIACSFWAPQIVACAVDDHRPPQSVEFIVGATAARALTPLYVFACPASGAWSRDGKSEEAATTNGRIIFNHCSFSTGTHHTFSD
jgi:hypothetical protein